MIIRLSTQRTYHCTDCFVRTVGVLEYRFRYGTRCQHLTSASWFVDLFQGGRGRREDLFHGGWGRRKQRKTSAACTEQRLALDRENGFTRFLWLTIHSFGLPADGQTGFLILVAEVQDCICGEVRYEAMLSLF